MEVCSWCAERDTPQAAVRPAPYHERTIAAASEALAVLLEEDPTQDTRDRYGRALRHVQLEAAPGQWVNLGQTLIAEGYAHPYIYRVPSMYADVFRAAQEQATASGAGLWNPAACAGQARPVADLDDQASTLAAYSGPHDPLGADKDCGDFATWDDAQSFFLAAGEGDPHWLDADQDCIACEALASSAGVPACRPGARACWCRPSRRRRGTAGGRWPCFG